MIIIFLLLILLVVIVIYFIKNKIRIKLDTFLKKGILAQSDRFGVYCFHAKQGQGKTYNCVRFLMNNRHNMPIISNIHLFNFDVPYIYETDYNKILEMSKDGGKLILYDEIFSKFNKNSKTDPETINFLSQMRKRGNILLTTAQDWLELPVWLRRKVKIDIQCSRRNILWFTIIKEVYGDADNMKWDNNENEYISPIIMTSISKMNKEIANAYDTYETIDTQ